jgi:hypothetical protein
MRSAEGQRTAPGTKKPKRKHSKERPNAESRKTPPQIASTWEILVMSGRLVQRLSPTTEPSGRRRKQSHEGPRNAAKADDSAEAAREHADARIETINDELCRGRCDAPRRGALCLR